MNHIKDIPRTVTLAEAEHCPRLFTNVRVYFPVSERTENGISNVILFLNTWKSTRLSGSRFLPFTLHLAVGFGEASIGIL